MIDFSTFNPGCVSEKTDSRAALAAVFFQSDTPIPRKHSLKSPRPTKSQYQFPFCVGMACARIIVYANLRDGINQDQSGKFIYAKAKQIDGRPDIYGTWLTTGLDVITKIGDTPEKDWALDPKQTYEQAIKNPPDSLDKVAAPYKIKKYIQFSTANKDLIKRYILDEKLPVLVGSEGNNESWGYLSVNSKNGYKIQDYKTAVWSHAFTIVGWDDDLDCWEIENSWGEDWGLKDRAFLKYNYKGLFANSHGVYDLPNNWPEIQQIVKTKYFYQARAMAYALYTQVLGREPESAYVLDKHAEFLSLQLLNGGQDGINQWIRGFIPEIITKYGGSK